MIQLHTIFEDIKKHDMSQANTNPHRNQREHADHGKRKKKCSLHEMMFMEEVPAEPSFSASFSIILKFSAFFSPRPPVTTTRAFPRSGRSVS